MSKTILITGTSSGFGKLMVLDLAKRGHIVIAAMRNVASKNASVATELNALDNVEVVEMDVTSTESVNAAVESILWKYGKIDVLVNNAGVTGVGPFEATSIEQMKAMFEVNLWGTVRGYLAVLPSMRQNSSGLIINITSGLAMFAAPYLGPYIGSKFAIEGITEALSYEVASYGIESVTVMPGPFPTEIGSKEGYGADRPEIVASYGSEAAEQIQKMLGAMFSKVAEYHMEPQEVADAVRKLIDMEPGKRPAQTSVNRITGNLEQEFADAKIPVKREWLKRLASISQ